MSLNKLLVCNSFIVIIQQDDEKEKELMKELELEEDEFMKQYHFKRLLQMKEEQDRKIAETRPKFGHVIEITHSDEFLKVIDKEHLHVVIIIHLYNEVISITDMASSLRGGEGMGASYIGMFWMIFIY